uniref:Type III restriction endonuclease subunit M n=1 Tax=Mammaliicoccus sciuri TaxID=1296 RepID=A0A1S6QLS9_MAMSC|nr:type III restriction endonuclease subunit M [Mammaliicoccus sciuri]AQW34740.1 type III restriction endonuclease subunit M [Mammaliicoccus sciuri]
MKTKINEAIKQVLQQFGDKYFIGEVLNKNKVIQDLDTYDQDLLEAFISNETLKSNFTIDIAGNIVMQTNKLIELFEADEYWQDSYTKYSKKIGLTAGGKFIDESTDVVLDFPYKDTVLKASMSKEDTDKDDRRPNELFLNEVIAKEEIDVLLDKKLLVNAKKYDENGEHEIDNFNKDDNLIMKGNNLLALHTLKSCYAGKVQTIYIDPPFNTGNDSFKYNDKFNRSSWLVFMKNRLEVARDLMKNDGTIFVHIDHNESHYLKLLMDDIFGEENFINEIVWCYTGPGYWKNRFVRKHDSIFLYSKTKSYKFNPQFVDYKTGIHVNKTGEVTTYGGGKKESSASELEKRGKPVEDWWDDIYTVDRVRSEQISFDGQKPEKLIERILSAGSDEGDLVLDFHLGTATTSSVAHKLKRRYIGIEQMDYINTISIPRLLKVIEGDQTGISKDFDWQGGGSFVYVELMEKNRGFLKSIQDAETQTELHNVFDFMLNEAEIDFRVDLEAVKDTLHELSFDDQKKALIKIIDKNQLYYNYSEIDDENVRDLISDGDYAFNKNFYDEGGE